MALSDYIPRQPRRQLSAAEVARRNAEARKRAKARAKAKRAKAKTVRKGTQAKRQASRSPGGFAEGGVIKVETWYDQVKRKYGG